MSDIRKEIKSRYFHIVRLAIAERWHNITSDAEFAEAMDLFPTALSNIKLQDGRNITTEMIYKMCKKFDVNANYLITGELPYLNSKSTAEKKLLKIEKILKS